MKNNIHKKLTEEDRFSRQFACWAQNHRSGAWRKYKRRTRRLYRRICKKQMTLADILDAYTDEGCPDPGAAMGGENEEPRRTE